MRERQMEEEEDTFEELMIEQKKMVQDSIMTILAPFMLRTLETKEQVNLFLSENGFEER